MLYSDIRIPQDEDGNFIITDPKLLEVTYTVNTTRGVREKDYFKYPMTITWNCKECGKKVVVQFRKGNIENYKPMLCNEHLRISRYGFVSPFQNPKTQENIKKIFLDKYGVEHPLQSQEIHDKISENNLAKFGNKSTLHDGGETEAKVTKIFLEKFGVEHPLQNKEIYNKTVESLIQNTGYDNPFKNPETRRKSAEKQIEKFGVDNVFKLPGFHEESDMKKLEKYGSKNNYKKANMTRAAFPEEKKKKILEQRKQTNLKKFGREFYVGSDTWFEQMMRDYNGLNVNIRFNYYGVIFDSSWELAVWIYCIDHNIPIVRNYGAISYKFEDKYGKPKHYIPDFIINGKIIEVKGDHFRNKDTGTLKPCFSHDSKNNKLSDDELSYKEDFSIRKYQCAIDNGVEFWYKKECQNAIDYAKNKFGGNCWFRRFDISNPLNPSYWCITNNAGYYNPQYFAPYLINTMNNGKGLTPYDVDRSQQYAPVTRSGITPFDY